MDQLINSFEFINVLHISLAFFYIVFIGLIINLVFINNCKFSSGYIFLSYKDLFLLYCLQKNLNYLLIDFLVIMDVIVLFIWVYYQ
jgi:hypothetical protein